MNKKVLVALLVVLSMVTVFSLSFAAEAKKPAVPNPPAATTKLPKPAFSMVSGTILKIDAADPANMKIEVKNDADNTTHVISVSPMTQITKATDITELKTGDAVRVMARKADNKEIAMGIVFGKLAVRPAPKPVGATTPPPAAKGAKK